ncbi:hypothetical protein HWI79_1968 [Cryptosporidium felis]|nr:hypothetical protein HWI79_1968 [Cryptosporidium felis]
MIPVIANITENPVQAGLAPVPLVNSVTGWTGLKVILGQGSNGGGFHRSGGEGFLGAKGWDYGFGKQRGSSPSPPPTEPGEVESLLSGNSNSVQEPGDDFVDKDLDEIFPLVDVEDILIGTVGVVRLELNILGKQRIVRYWETLGGLPRGKDKAVITQKADSETCLQVLVNCVAHVNISVYVQLLLLSVDDLVVALDDVAVENSEKS